MSQSRKVLGNSLWGAFNALVELVLPTITSILVARAMGPERLGAFVYVMWIAMMASTVGTLGIPVAAMKYLSDYAGKGRGDVVWSIFVRGAALQAAVALATATGAVLWVALALPADEHAFATLAVLGILPYGLMGMPTAMNTVREDLGANAVPSIVGGLTHAAAIVVVLVLDLGLTGLAGAHLLGRVVDAALRWALLFRSLPGYFRTFAPTAEPARLLGPLPPGLVAEVVRFCALQSLLLFISLVVRNRSEVFFLRQFCDLHAIAFYSVAFGFSQLPGQLAMPFSMAAMASLFVERGRSDAAGLRFVQIYWRYMALLVLPAALGLAALSGPLIRVLYGPAYHDAAPVLLVGAALSMAGPLGTPFTDFATSAGKLRLLVLGGLFAAAVTLVLDAGFIYWFGAVGAAAANGLGQVTGTVTIWVLVNRACGTTLPGRFALRLLAASGGMAAVVGLFALLVPDLLALVAGPFLGAAVFTLGLRLARVLEVEDLGRLLDAGKVLPTRLRPLFREVVGRIVGPAT